MKGMGWKEGSAASRTRKGLVQPYNPTPRPAMLGIGAKERIVPEGEQLKGKQKWKAKEEARKYMPVMRKEVSFRPCIMPALIHAGLPIVSRQREGPVS